MHVLNRDTTSAHSAEMQDAFHIDWESGSAAPRIWSQHVLAKMGTRASLAAQAGLEPEHWLPMFVADLTSQIRTAGEISFELAERLLQQRKDDFLRDFLTARRMYRTYPALFPEIQDRRDVAADPF